jgi:hypothetical protein
MRVRGAPGGHEGAEGRAGTIAQGGHEGAEGRAATNAQGGHEGAEGRAGTNAQGGHAGRPAGAWAWGGRPQTARRALPYQAVAVEASLIPSASSQRSASIAALQPSAAAVTACL